MQITTAPSVGLEAPGANNRQIWRGIAAAEAVFALRGITARGAYDALGARETDAMTGAMEPGNEHLRVSTEHDNAHWLTWEDAAEAALEACYGDEIHPEAWMFLVEDQGTSVSSL